ncbi:beta-glucuronidase, partial [Neobacillus vireti]
FVTEKDIPGGGKVIRNQPNFDFFNYAGLHRPVKIYTTPATYVKDVTVITELDGKVHYSIDVAGSAHVKVKAVDDLGVVVGEAEGVSETITIPNVKLWEPLN